MALSILKCGPWTVGPPLAALALCAGHAAAAGLEGVLALQSDKVVRAFSQSGGDAVLVADGSWRGDTGWAFNAGLSTLGRDRRRGNAELTLGAGYGGTWTNTLAWQLSATRYRTLGSGENRRGAYGEYAASLGWAGRLQALVSASPAYPGTLPAGAGGGSGHGRARFAEVTWHQPVWRSWALDAGIGRADYAGLAFADYSYGSLGLSWRHGRLQVIASRIFSNSQSPNAVGPRAVVSVLWSL